MTDEGQDSGDFVNPAASPQGSSLTSQGSASSPTNVRWRIVGLLMSLCFISHLNRASMAVAGTDRIMDQFQIDPVKMGTIYSAFLLVYSICMIPGGVSIGWGAARFDAGGI